MKISIPAVLTFNGGYVDTAGFLALQGLFTAHVTGNFVTIGAGLAHGTSGLVAKLLALPVFCAVVVLVRYFSGSLSHLGTTVLNVLLGLKLMLFVVAAVLALRMGPFENGDSAAAIATGMTLVAAMAIQNAVHRIFFPKAPPTTLMTGSTTQIMIDLADLARRGLSPEARAEAKGRCARLGRSVVIFAVGCAIAALIYVTAGSWVFALPPLLMAVLLPATRSGEAAAAA